jgi:FKBP-type peptidyl-prolyl cis-trans isomerase (trigger factor)
MVLPQKVLDFDCPEAVLEEVVLEDAPEDVLEDAVEEAVLEVAEQEGAQLVELEVAAAAVAAAVEIELRPLVHPTELRNIQLLGELCIPVHVDALEFLANVSY